MKKRGRAFQTKEKAYAKNQRFEKTGVYTGVQREIRDSSSQWSQIEAKLQRALIRKSFSFKAVGSYM